MAYKGRFVPINKEKYKGNYNNITYRSSWESYVMKWLDNNPDVLKWNSEDCIIPYFSTADGKNRRYFMDFWVKFKNGSEFFLEVKPYKETQPPVKPKRLTSKSKNRYLQELYTYSVNMDKWKAAKAVSDKVGIKFRLVTEKSLKQLGWKG